jgi:hypothetical protein
MQLSVHLSRLLYAVGPCSVFLLAAQAFATGCDIQSPDRGIALDYEQALDCIFEPSTGFDWVLRARFVPSSQGEMEFSVGRISSTKYVLWKKVLATPVHSLFRDHKILDREGIARLNAIPVLEMKLSVNSKQAAGWVAEFLRAVSLTSSYVQSSSGFDRETDETRIVLDGTRYTAILREIQSEIRLSFQGPEIRPESPLLESVPPIVMWMRDFKKKIEMLTTADKSDQSNVAPPK